MKRWYKEIDDRAPLHTKLTIKRIMSERVALYHRVPHPRENILETVAPFMSNDSVLEEEEIEWAIKQICYNRYRRPSGMRAEKIWQCLTEDMKAEAT